MSKLFIKLSILVFVFSILISSQKSFAQVNDYIPQNTCTQTYATYNKAVVSANDLVIPNYRLCVNDGDTGQTVIVTSSRGNITGGTISANSVPSGNNIPVRYSDIFLVSDIGRSTTVNFTANDGFISSSIATLMLSFTPAPITATINGAAVPSGTNVGPNYNAGESKTVSCTNSTYLNISNGYIVYTYTNVISGSDANEYNLSYTFNTSAAVAKYTIKCGNIAGEQINYTINLNQPTLKSATNNTATNIPTNNTGIYYFIGGNSASITAGNATKLKIIATNKYSGSVQTVCEKSGDGDINCSFDMNDFYPLDDTTFTVTYSNVLEAKSFSFERKAKPVIVTANIDQTGPTGKDASLNWSSDGDSCEVKYSDGNGNYISFVPTVPNPSTNNLTTTDRKSVSWSATVPTKNLGDGIYGYQVYCKDKDHTNRADGQLGQQINLTLSSNPVATISPDTTNPNWLDWKCVNSVSSSIDNGSWASTLSGSIKNDGSSHTVECKDKAGNVVTDTYNPSVLTATQGVQSNGNPEVTTNYSCPSSATRSELWRGSTKLNITTLNGSFKDINVAAGSTYTYKLYCYDTTGKLIAYSEKTITIGVATSCPTGYTLQSDKSCKKDDIGVITPISCSYNDSDQSVNCSNIPTCEDGTFATQFNLVTSGSPATPPTSSGSATSRYIYTDGNNKNIYQYKFVCAATGKIIKIINALVPPYSHFINFNVSSAYVQAGANVNLNWLIQNPNTSCSISAKEISTGSDITASTPLSLQSITGNDLNRDIKGVGVAATTANGGFTTNGNVSVNITKSTRFTASCNESRFPGTILNGPHSIVKDVYVIGEREQ